MHVLLAAGSHLILSRRYLRFDGLLRYENKLMRFGVMGLNFKSAKIKERESLACAFELLFGKRSRHSTVLLSTCNRCEVYFYDPDPAELHTQFLKEMRMTLTNEFDHHLYSYFDQECLAHLSKVTAGFDSAFLGETEIQHQVKCAYIKASDQKKTAF